MIIPNYRSVQPADVGALIPTNEQLQWLEHTLVIGHEGDFVAVDSKILLGMVTELLIYRQEEEKRAPVASDMVGLFLRDMPPKAPPEMSPIRRGS